MKVLFADDSNDKEKWISIWKTFSNKEPYAHPDYLTLYKNVGCRCCCAVYNNDEEYIIYPFLLRCINNEEAFGDLPDVLYDIISPYGYGGCYFSGIEGNGNDDLFNFFYSDFKEWALNNNVISEFIRFSLGNPYMKFYPGELVYNNDNIVIDLTKDDDTLWKEFKPKVRKNVNRARSENLIVIADQCGEYLEDFLKIYYETMSRRNANEGYYFPKEYFISLNENLKGNYTYFHVLLDNKVISTELALVSDDNIYSFLGGTKDDYFHIRPNDLLKYEMILWAKKEGIKSFVLGGGYTPNDGIFNYKLAFAPNGVKPFYIGKNIYNNELYKELVDISINKKNDFDVNSSFFPLYRAN